MASDVKPELIGQYALDDHPEYRSAFSLWDERASVRSGGRRRGSDGHAVGLLFPPELAPVVTHPIIVDSGLAERLLGLTLVDYLNYTVELEETCVVPVASALGRGLHPLPLPLEMRLDALRISTDESYHSLFTLQMAAEVEAHLGLGGKAPLKWRFMRAIALEVEAAGQTDAYLIRLVSAVVSETLISSKLRQLPRDARLNRSVRQMAADHAQDEARHHAYFKAILPILWRHVTLRERVVVGCAVPRLIRAFLEPDLARDAELLVELGIDPIVAAKVVEESNPIGDLLGQTRSSAKETIRYFRDVGALDVAQIRDEFHASLLI